MSDLMRQWYDNLDEEKQYLFDERAAIFEYEGKMPRYIAERYAQRHICRMIRDERVLNEQGVPFSAVAGEVRDER